MTTIPDPNHALLVAARASRLTDREPAAIVRSATLWCAVFAVALDEADRLDANQIAIGDVERRDWHGTPDEARAALGSLLALAARVQRKHQDGARA